MVAEAPAHLADPCSIPENTHQRLSVMGSRTLFLLGDVYGRFDHVLHEALSRRPAGVVFLGDIGAAAQHARVDRPVRGITDCGRDSQKPRPQL